MSRALLNTASLLGILGTLTFTAVLPAQRTWVVDDRMAAGADFPDLVSAYNAASWNDRIQVRFGTGAGYAFPAGISRPIRLLGLGTGVNVRKPVLFYPAASISCPANEMIVIDNFEIRTSGTHSWLTSIANSPGLVVLSRIDYSALRFVPVTPYHAHRVVMVDCVAVAPSTSITSIRSDLWVLNCQTSGASGGISYQNGNIEVRDRSFLRVVGGRHVGGDGIAECWPLSAGYVGKPAIWSGQGPTIVSGPTTLIGGLYQVAHPTCGGGSGVQRVSAITSACQGTVIDPLVNMNNLGPFPPCPRDISHEMPAVIPGPAARGQRQTIDTWGPSNSIVAVFASFLPAFDPIVLPFGDVWLDPYLTLHVATGAVDAQRHATFTTTIPSWLAIGDVLVYQAVSLSPQNTFEISQPGIAVVH